jgi:hypothetical protein
VFWRFYTNKYILSNTTVWKALNSTNLPRIDGQSSSLLSFWLVINPLNAELNPICQLLALLGGATIVVVSKLRVKLLIVSMRDKLCEQREIPSWDTSQRIIEFQPINFLKVTTRSAAIHKTSTHQSISRAKSLQIPLIPKSLRTPRIF